MSAKKKIIYCALDLEGTGLDPKKDAIIEAGAVLFTISPGGELEFLEEFSELVKPPIPIPEFIQKLTSIRESDVANARVWAEVSPEFSKFVGQHVIVGQNIQFDLAFLEATGLHFSQGAIDTRELASMFLPGARFYNLEYLMRFFQAPLTLHHRALDDAKSAAKLLQLLIQHFHTLPETIQAQAAKLLRASGLPYRSLFAPGRALPRRKRADEAGTDQSSATSEDKPASGEQGALFDLAHARTLPTEISPVLEMEKFLDRPGVIFVDFGLLEFSAQSLARLAEAVSARNQRAVLSVGSDAEFAQLQSWGGERALILDDPKNYLCDFSLRKWISRRHRPDTFTRFLVKLLVWQVENPTGSLGQMSLLGEDYTYISLVSGNLKTCLAHAAEEPCRLVQALAGLEKAPIVFTRHSAWLNLGISRPQKDLAKNEIFWNLETLEQVAFAKVSTTFSFKSLRALICALYDPEQKTGILEGLSRQAKQSFEQSLNQLDLTFGLWSIVLIRELLVSSQRVVDAALRESSAFGKLFASGSDLLSRLRALMLALPADAHLKPEFTRPLEELRLHLELLEEFLEHPDPNKIFWIDIYNGRLKIKSQAISSPLPPTSQLTCRMFCGVASDESVKQYYRRIFSQEQAETETLPVLRPKLSVFMAADLPQKESPGAQKGALRILEQVLPALDKRSVVLFSSQKTLDHAYHALPLENFKDRLLVQKFTGHHWKNLENFRKQPAAIWFLTVSNFLKNIQILPQTANLLLMRLPYESPGVLAEAYDPDEIFSAYVLPKTALRLQSILKRFFGDASAGLKTESSSGSGPDKRLIVLDSRLGLDYNSPLLAMLRRLCETEEKEFFQDDPLVCCQ